METRQGWVLKHKETGWYWSRMAVPSRRLFEAMRFQDEEQAAVWLEASIYAPPEPEAFELVPVRMTIEEVAESDGESDG
ncbi:hypothetical protein MJA45_27210 [Paenibacillus aurantius]|uniref:Uncharacterized protein n=1 Tax=Paenibacillus aurantius TaxID=2918900 RepID=A0AA96RFA3_9BACL|nr:hypothetical protein [Paenibacillus aurantius]WNQ11246.1 hypothetical protein MJA45_27210 [Paenibacillus aurantius]